MQLDIITPSRAQKRQLKVQAAELLDAMGWPSRLGNIDRSSKTVKGLAYGVTTFIVYHSPGTLSGRNVCTSASRGCLRVCLHTAGRGSMHCTQRARLRKTEAFFSDRPRYMLQLEKELASFARSARRRELIPAVRLNGTSDIKWERIAFIGKDGKRYGSIMERFPSLQFYDYTKHTPAERPGVGDLPNYHITFSYAEDNHARALEALGYGWNVAVVFRHTLPAKWQGREVIDGDTSDIRFADKAGCIVGLIAKGKAKKDCSGFVVDGGE